MKEIFEAISVYGFPVVVATYLLFRQESKMDNLSNLITKKDGIQDKIEEVLELLKGLIK